jgi:hypothetical protein
MLSEQFRQGAANQVAEKGRRRRVNFSLALFCRAAFQVLLELLLRIKFCSAHGAFVRLARFMFF